MKIEQEIMKIFNKQFKDVTFIEFDKGDWSRDVKKYHDKEVRDFISHIITLVQKRERKEAVEKLEGMKDKIKNTYPFNTFTGETQEEMVRAVEGLIKVEISNIVSKLSKTLPDTKLEEMSEYEKGIAKALQGVIEKIK